MRGRYYLSSALAALACFFPLSSFLIQPRVVNASSRLKNATLRNGFWWFFHVLSSVTLSLLLLLLTTSSSLPLRRFSFFSLFLFSPFLPSPFSFLSSPFPRRNQWESIEISLSKRSTDLFPIIGNLLVRTSNVVGLFEFVRRVFSTPSADRNR